LTNLAKHAFINVGSALGSFILSASKDRKGSK
jgi:hypothetical protein